MILGRKAESHLPSNISRFGQKVKVSFCPDSLHFIEPCVPLVDLGCLIILTGKGIITKGFLF
jgi:hypothetical protein